MVDVQVTKLKEIVEQAVPYLPVEIDLEFKSMFGGMMAYARGQVFASLSNIGLALKLSPALQQELLKEVGAKYLQYEEDGPISKQYVVIPLPMLHNHEKLAHWLKVSIDYVATLPLKKKKRR